MLVEQSNRAVQKEQARLSQSSIAIKIIIQALKSSKTESIAKQLQSFCNSKPLPRHYKKLGDLILEIRKKDRQLIDSFVYLVKQLQAYCKDKQQACKQQKFSEHIHHIRASLKTDEIGNWLNLIKQWIKKNKKPIKQLQRLRNRGSLDEGKLYKERKIQSYEHHNDRILMKPVVGIEDQDRSMGGSLRPKPEKSDRLKQQLSNMKQLIQSVSIKIDVLTQKYSLAGVSPLQKLDAIEQYLRSTTLNLHQLIANKQRQIENQYNKRFQELKEDRDNLWQKLSSYQLRQAGNGHYRQNKMGAQGKTSATVVRVQQKQQGRTVVIPNLLSQFLPESDIVDKKDQESFKFLKEKIFKLGKVRPKAAKSVFSSKREGTNNNIHQYIDNLQNLLIIAKLTNGIILGGFTHQEFKPNCGGRNGFIFSLTKQETFERMVGSTIYYDPSSIIIFGKSELKIKVKEMLLFSNFGSQQRNFDCKKKRVQDFLGCGQAKSAQISVFEIYQVIPA